MCLTHPMMNTDTINLHLPIIDFQPFLDGQDRLGVAQELHHAIRDYGFFYLTNHQLSSAIIGECLHQAHSFFDLPISEKRKIHISKSNCHRGWYGHGEEVLDKATQAEGDMKEGLKIGNDLSDAHPFVKQNIPLHGANQWPHDPAFQKAMQAAYRAFEKLSQKLMQALALSLGLDDAHFNDFLHCPMATLSPLRYPATDKPDKGKNAGAHTDFGCLTLLVQQDNAGLEVLAKKEHWLAVPPIDGTLVVNIGDMMDVWSDGLYPSTRHRVTNTSNTARHSLAFFYDPQYDTPLKSLTGKTRNGKTTLALDHLMTKIGTSFNYMEKQK